MAERDNSFSSPLQEAFSQRLSRRQFIKQSALAAGVALAPSFLRPEQSSARNINASRFNLEFVGDPNVQIENLKQNIREMKRISASSLIEIQEEVGTKVRLQLGTFPAPVLQAESQHTPRYSLVNPEDPEKYFPNMCVDNFPVTDQGGSQLQLQGIYLGRITRPIETSIGETYADIGFTYRWLGGDDEENMTEIIEPSWMAWRSPNNSVSNFAVIMNTEGNFPYPQDVSRATDSNGATLVEELDKGIGTTAIDVVTGHPFEAIEWSAEAAAQGWPGEFYTYDAVQAMIDASQKHYDVYRLATLAQAQKDGYSIKWIDEVPNLPPTEIVQATPEITDLNIKDILKELPNYKDYLRTDPITLDELLPLLRVHSAAIAPFSS